MLLEQNTEGHAAHLSDKFLNFDTSFKDCLSSLVATNKMEFHAKFSAVPLMNK
jgi:hypothetical protein